MTTRSFYATARRSQGWWALEVTGDGLSNPAFTQARRLDQAEDVVRDLLAVHFGVDTIETGHIEIVPVLEAALADVISQTRSTREQAERLRVDATYLTRQTARRLKAEGLPQRDISVLLGVSHQVVSQMLAS
jgi:predicted XRE-type DNA-binding protein